MPVALHLVAERADHLAMAHVATLADVDVAPCLFERGIGPHPLYFLDSIVEIEQRGDLHEPPDGYGHECADGQQGDVALEPLVALDGFFDDGIGHGLRDPIRPERRWAG